MTRQIAELVLQRDHVTFHITSNDPLRAENGPDIWEEKSLHSFVTHQKENYAWWTDKNNDRFFRYMAPLFATKPCLTCHEAPEQQPENFLRGGISVTIPSESILTNQDNYIKMIILAYFFIWSLGSIGLLVAYRHVADSMKKREDLVKQLEKTLQGFIPICSSCKSIRENDGNWETIEDYIHDHSDAKFTHSICPSCAAKLYPDLDFYKKDK